MTWKGNPRTSTRAWRATRQRILAHYGHTCYQCGGPATEVDHVQPLSEGGTDDDHNLAAICRPCHRRKSSAEGGRAKARRQRITTTRPPDRHPGLID